MCSYLWIAVGPRSPISYSCKPSPSCIEKQQQFLTIQSRNTTNNVRSLKVQKGRLMLRCVTSRASQMTGFLHMLLLMLLFGSGCLISVSLQLLRFNFQGSETIKYILYKVNLKAPQSKKKFQPRRRRPGAWKGEGTRVVVSVL